MFDEVPSSNPLDLPMPTEGEYVWHLEVIVVVVRIDPVSREYETSPVADSASIKKKEVTCTLLCGGIKWSPRGFSTRFSSLINQKTRV